MAKIEGLIQRKKTYYIRVRVPKDLLVIYAPKKEITQSLGTKNYSDAVLKFKKVQATILADFEFKRKSAPNGKPPTDMLPTLSEETLTSFAQDWCERAWQNALKDHAVQKETYTPIERDEIRDVLSMEKALAEDEVSNIRNPYNFSGPWSGAIIANEILEAKGISFNKESEQYDWFRFICSRAHLEYITRYLNFWDGKKHKPTDLMFAQKNSYQLSVAPALMGQVGSKLITLNKLFEEHINNPSSEMSDSTKKNYIIPLRILMHVVGEHRPIHEITREDCKKVRELLRGLPTNYKKKLGNVGIDEAIKSGTEQNLDMASIGTINGHLQKICALLGYAVTEGYIQTNPARDLLLKDKEAAKNKRDPFDIAVLRTIFSSGVYAETDTANYKCYAVSQDNKKTPLLRYSYFWVPLIALFSGMRLGEICQINISDIQNQNGIAIMNVRTEIDKNDDLDNAELKKLKTVQSIRIVPIHPLLLKVGFLDYVESLKKFDEIKVFPDVKVASTGYYSGNFSKYYSRHLKKLKVKTKKTSFHSYRHNFRDAEREAEIPETISQQLGGWTTGKTDANYGKGVKVETLAKWMDKIDYPELEFSHLLK